MAGVLVLLGWDIFWVGDTFTLEHCVSVVYFFGSLLLLEQGEGYRDVSRWRWKELGSNLICLAWM